MPQVTLHSNDKPAVIRDFADARQPSSRGR